MASSDCSLKSRVLFVLVTLVFAQASLVEADERQTIQSELQEYLVVGTVISVHPGSSSISIRGARLLEYLHMQVRSYRVKQPGSLLDLRPGDKVTAIFSTKDGMLHRLRRIQTLAKQKRASQ